MQTPAGTQEAAAREMPPISEQTTSLPPAPTIVGPTGDACPNCGAAMAGDQRYCVDCGERRGDPRLPFMDGRTAAEPAAPATGAAAPVGYAAQPPSRQRWSGPLALLSTIALLLLAMGVGVLIGNTGDDKNSVAQQPVVIGGAAVGASAATAATGAGKDSAAAAETTEKAGVDANAVAKKNGVKLAKPDVKLGDKCEKGAAGCSESGEFDGSFFGE